MHHLILKYGKYFIFSLYFILATPACDDIIESPIPDVFVSFTIDLNIVNELYHEGMSVFFPLVGYGGVIVYCEQPGIYYAFDAACPYDIRPDCIVKNEGPLADCPCCGSQFLLINGDPIKPPASVPLKQYHVSLLNSTTLRIHN
ncbi:MAG: hypothetical protein WCY58_08100 [Mariniphaga sp.]|nr:hypothetical protein [Mariniphaga sp.]MDD4226103.1 hypothetical protein [Mariniphaga sp.]MDD4424412.1 hypothetical protein [Mariniphaga sp.]